MQSRKVIACIMACLCANLMSAQKNNAHKLQIHQYHYAATIDKSQLAKQAPAASIKMAQFGSESLNGCSQKQSDFNHKAIAFARTVVATKVFEERLHTQMKALYQKCKNDPFYDADFETQYQKVLAACRSVEGIDVNCSGAENANANAEVGSYDLDKNTEFNWGAWMAGVVDQLDRTTICVNGNQTNDCRWAAYPWPYSQAAGIVWHELMHQYGYLHGDGTNDENKKYCAIDPSNTTWDFQVNTVPYIVGNVINEIIDKSEAVLGNIDDCPSPNQIKILDKWDGKTGSCVSDPGRKGLGIMSLDNSMLHDVAILPESAWIDAWHYSTNDEIVGSGDFNADGNKDFIIRSDWGIGIVTYASPHWRTLFIAPANAVFGDWHYSTKDTIQLIGDFNGDGRDDIFLKSSWGVGILTFNANEELKPLVMAPYGSWLDKWQVRRSDKFLKVGDFDGNGYKDMLVTSSWGMGVVAMNLTGNGWFSYFVKPYDSWLGSWHLDAKDVIAGVGNFSGTSYDEIAIRSSWGLGILRLDGPNSMKSLAAVPYNTFLGSWNLTKDDKIPLAGDFDGDGKADLLLSSGWGVGLVHLSNNQLVSYLAKPNGTRFGDWQLNTTTDKFLAKGSFVTAAKKDVVVESPWGIGILTTNPAAQTFTSASVQPYRTFLGSWVMEDIDRLAGAGNYDKTTKLDKLLLEKQVGADPKSLTDEIITVLTLGLL